MSSIVEVFLLTSQSLSQSRDKTFVVTQFCAPFAEMFETPKKYKEDMLFLGNGMQLSAADGKMYTGGMFFFVNQETGTYSIINVYGDGIACMMQTGRNFEPYSGPNPDYEGMLKKEKENEL